MTVGRNINKKAAINATIHRKCCFAFATANSSVHKINTI